MVGRDSIIIIKVFIVCTSVLFKRRVLDHICARSMLVYIYIYICISPSMYAQEPYARVRALYRVFRGTVRSMVERFLKRADR